MISTDAGGATSPSRARPVRSTARTRSTLTAGSGDVVLGGVVGGIAPLASIHMSANNLTLPGDQYDLNQTLHGPQPHHAQPEPHLDAPISFTADCGRQRQRPFILLNGVSLTTSNNRSRSSPRISTCRATARCSRAAVSCRSPPAMRATSHWAVADAAGQMTITAATRASAAPAGSISTPPVPGWIQAGRHRRDESQNITGTLTSRRARVGRCELHHRARPRSTLSPSNRPQAVRSISVKMFRRPTTPIIFVSPTSSQHRHCRERRWTVSFQARSL